MSDYSIIVHVVKSDCKYFVIMTLAELAYQHELKGKDKDIIDFISKNYKKLINMVRDYVTICKEYLDRD